MDNIRPAGFGILNRNPHAAKSPAYSQIWENVCHSHGCKRHAQCDKRQNPRCVLSARPGVESQSKPALKGKGTTPEKGGRMPPLRTMSLFWSYLDDNVIAKVLLNVK